jgi:hypothetical protein
MWDFSWLERRWPGAGYEDWDQALSELAERGYDSVRIDAFPHLIAVDGEKSWNLVPVWSQTSWGAQSPITVSRVLPALIEFIGKAASHGIDVALSTWFREDVDNVRMRLRTPEEHAAAWAVVLRAIDEAGLLDHIVYVDLCNEFNLKIWAPFVFRQDDPDDLSRTDPRMIEWMSRSIGRLREEFPELVYTFSFSNELDNWQQQDVSMLDILEPHVWMSTTLDEKYNDAVGYHFEKFDPIGFDNLVRNGRREYEQNQAEYDKALFGRIDSMAAWSRASGCPLFTTECWTIVDYKDWPGLDWDWVMDLNARAVEYALGTGRWVGLATSNFCGPQFVGMWRDVAWHQRLTSAIHASQPEVTLQTASHAQAED